MKNRKAKKIILLILKVLCVVVLGLYTIATLVCIEYVSGIFAFMGGMAFVGGVLLAENICDSDNPKDSENRHGKWIFLGLDDNSDLPMYQCSKCKIKQFGASRYCPNCGAKMVENEVKPK